jgi:hypothetical protein
MGRPDYRVATVLTFLAAMMLLGMAGITWGQDRGVAALHKALPDCAIEGALEAQVVEAPAEEWKPAAFPGVEAVRFVSPQLGLIVAGSGIYRSDGDPMKWIGIGTAKTDTTAIDIIGGSDGTAILTSQETAMDLPGGHATKMDLMSYSVEKGFTSITTIPLGVRCGFGSDKIGCYPVGADIFTTVDGGKTWIANSHVVPATHTIDRLKFIGKNEVVISDGDMVLVGTIDDQGIFKIRMRQEMNGALNDAGDFTYDPTHDVIWIAGFGDVVGIKRASGNPWKTFTPDIPTGFGGCAVAGNLMYVWRDMNFLVEDIDKNVVVSTQKAPNSPIEIVIPKFDGVGAYAVTHDGYFYEWNGKSNELKAVVPQVDSKPIQKALTDMLENNPGYQAQLWAHKAMIADPAGCMKVEQEATEKQFADHTAMVTWEMEQYKAVVANAKPPTDPLMKAAQDVEELMDQVDPNAAAKIAVEAMKKNQNKEFASPLDETLWMEKQLKALANQPKPSAYPSTNPSNP